MDVKWDIMGLCYVNHGCYGLLDVLNFKLKININSNVGFNLRKQRRTLFSNR